MSFAPLVQLAWNDPAINSVYDVLGWSSPVTILAKIIFDEICLLKLHWDDEVPDEIAKKWSTWVKALKHTPTVDVPHCASTINQSHFELHGFADASKMAVCTAIYAISYCGESPIDRNLLVTKSRVAPKNLSIPRLELVAAHALAKLRNNVENALKSFPVASSHNWVNSLTILYWLSDRGEWFTFVRNCLQKIKELQVQHGNRYPPVRTQVTLAREEPARTNWVSRGSRTRVAYRWIHWSYSA